MLFDTHVHIANGQTPEPETILRSMDEFGVDKTALFAEEPAYWETRQSEREKHNDARLSRLMRWCEKSGGRLVPIYFINPTEPDAIRQVHRALDAGAAGFKIICETFFPGDQRAMPVYAEIAGLNKAILFHCGTLWDFGSNAAYNRPAEFEAMLYVPKLRFALAHIGWPWCDETIATYGKFCAMEGSPLYTGQKMYIDMTPGTPDCYRREVLRKLVFVDYEHMNERLMLGTDCFTNDFSAQAARNLAKGDGDLLREAGMPEEGVLRMQGRNAMEFWGIN